ncbi:MAG: TRAP transporter substrate-binding protein DctP [Thermodesulfobacteriota bacterium]
MKKCGLCLLCLFLCLALSSASLAQGGGGKVFWKMATLAPEAIGWGKIIKEIGLPAMEDMTGGVLSVKIYWGGVMGDDTAIVGKMKQGVLSGGGLTGQGTNLICPEMNVVELPFLFENYEEVDAVRKKLLPVLDDLMEKRGFFLLVWMDQDFDQVYSTKFPMSSYGDFLNARFMTWYGVLEERMFQRIGVEAVPVPVPEVSQRVRKGDMNAAIGPGIWIVGAQLQSVIKYVNPLKIRYAPSVTVVRKDAWEALSESARRKYHERRGELTVKLCRAVRSTDEKYYRALLQYGVKETHLDSQSERIIREKAVRVWDTMVGVLYPQAMLDMVQETLKEFRQGRGK